MKVRSTLALDPRTSVEATQIRVRTDQHFSLNEPRDKYYLNTLKANGDQVFLEPTSRLDLWTLRRNVKSALQVRKRIYKDRQKFQFSFTIEIKEKNNRPGVLITRTS